MNPKISVGYEETGRWLRNFALSHAKHVAPRLEAVVDMEGERETRSYGLCLVLGEARSPAVELEFPEVADGRTRFAWCQALGERLRSQASTLVGQPVGERGADSLTAAPGVPPVRSSRPRRPGEGS